MLRRWRVVVGWGVVGVVVVVVAMAVVVHVLVVVVVVVVVVRRGSVKGNGSAEAHDRLWDVVKKSRQLLTVHGPLAVHVVDVKDELHLQEFM